MSFGRLKANLGKTFSGLRPVRLALAADSAAQHLVQALRGAGYEAGCDLAVFDSGFDQIEASLLNPESELYAFKPAYILIFHWAQRLLERYQATAPAARGEFASTHLRQVRSLVEAATQYSKARVLYVNFPEFSDGVQGNFSSKLPSSWLSQLRRINVGLMDLAVEFPNLFINDLAMLASGPAGGAVGDPKLGITAQMAFSLDFLPRFAENTLKIVSAVEGRVRKCLVLDLDNTLWGGVIGDDGLERIEVGGLGLGKAFCRVQRWAKQLKERGILLTVCSKNTDAVAREPFLKHPEMVLRLEDFALFVANWESKVDNLRLIQTTLNLGLDALVFVDDNPVERAWVREQLPEVLVPELPEDPVEYAEFLQALNLFETASVTQEDQERTLQYQQEAGRRELAAKFGNEAEFLASLEMEAVVEEFTPFNAPRVAQLTQRSNQFNLRTVRYTEADILHLAGSPEHLRFTFSLKDKFGSHGLVSVIILQLGRGEAFIDTWLMSCRVLKRSLENFVLNHLVAAARRAGADQVVGEYLPTSKNGLVEHHYRSLGFTPFDRDGRVLWSLDLSTFTPRETQIHPA